MCASFSWQRLVSNWLESRHVSPSTLSEVAQGSRGGPWQVGPRFADLAGPGAVAPACPRGEGRQREQDDPRDDLELA